MADINQSVPAPQESSMELYNPTFPPQVNQIIQGYVKAMLWAEVDDSGEPLEDNYTVDDLADETIERIQHECIKFWENIQGVEYRRSDLLDTISQEENLGHDLWLDPAGHGVGFWEPGRWNINGIPVGSSDQKNPLREAAYAVRGDYSTYSPYVGDDGKIYL